MTGFKIARLVGKLFDGILCKAKYRFDAALALKEGDHKAFLLCCTHAGIDSMESLTFAFDFFPELKAKAKAQVKAKAEAKAWKTIWSAGQGVTSIKDVLAVKDLVQQMKQEFKTSVAALQEMAKRYS